MSKKAINPRAIIELLAERFPKTFAVYERRRVPLKLNIFVPTCSLCWSIPR